MISTKQCIGIATLGVLIVQVLSLPQSVSFGGQSNADDKKNVKPRLGLVASVLGKTYILGIVDLWFVIILKSKVKAPH